MRIDIIDQNILRALQQSKTFLRSSQNRNKNPKGNLYLYIQLNRSYLQKLTIWHSPFYKYVAFYSNSNKLHRKSTVHLIMHNITNLNFITYSLARMTLSFPTNCLISLNLINLHPPQVYFCGKYETPANYNGNRKLSAKLLIKQTSCSYLCCQLKSHFISFSLQCSVVRSIKHKLQRSTTKLSFFVLNVY